MSIGVAVIGAGMMGGDHALRIDREISGAHVAAIADLRIERAQSIADRIELRGSKRPLVFADPFAAISAENVDAVVVVSDEEAHLAQVLKCVDLGLPVLCEKPLAPTADECRRIVTAEQDAEKGRLVSVGFMRRFDPGCADLRAAIETGELGNALMVHCVHRNADPYPGSGSEGSITSSAVHEFDFIPWLLGSPITEVAWLQGRRSRRAAQRIDPQMLLIRTADEVLTTLEVFVSAAYGYEVNCEVVFEQGTLALTEPTEVLRRESKRASYRFPDDSLRRYQAAYRGELQAWVDSVALDGPADPRLASAMDGLNATVSADTMIQAFRNGDGRFVRVSR